MHANLSLSAYSYQRAAWVNHELLLNHAYRHSLFFSFLIPTKTEVHSSHLVLLAKGKCKAGSVLKHPSAVKPCCAQLYINRRAYSCLAIWFRSIGLEAPPELKFVAENPIAENSVANNTGQLQIPQCWLLGGAINRPAYNRGSLSKSQ